MSTQELQIQQHTVDTSYAVGKTHLYTATVNGAQVLFDTGPPTEEGKDFLRANVDLQNLGYLFITHWHPDHCGLADFLATETDARIFFSRAEVKRFDIPLAETNGIFTQLGFPQSEAKKVSELAEKSRIVTPLPKRYELLEESAQFLEDELGISFFSGLWHSQSDVIYRFGNYAVIGDVAINGVFSAPLLDVDLNFDDGRRFCNYTAFCETISKLMAINELTLLSAHRRQLESVSAWLEFFLRKIIERAEVIAPHLRAGKSIYATVQDIFAGQITNKRFLTYLKTSEVVFISDFLRNPEPLIEALSRNQLCSQLAAELAKITPLPISNKRATHD